MRNPLTEWAILTGRNTKVFLSDRTSLTVILLQVPIITLLIGLSFSGFAKDHADSDYFARFVYFFNKAKAPYEARNDTVPLPEIIATADKLAKKDVGVISVLAANRRGAIYFVLVSAAIWLGIMGSCKDIVSEQHVLDRELRSCTRIIPYLLSKFSLHVVILAPLTGLMSAVIGFYLLDLRSAAVLYLWLILWLTSCTAAALGLAVSSVATDIRSGIASNIRMALTLVPILMMPQLMLGGLLRPPVAPGEGNILRQVCEHLTIQRWGFEAALYADPFVEDGIVLVKFNSSWDLKPRYAELNLLRSQTLGLMELLFKKNATRVPDGQALRMPVNVLLFMTSFLLLFSVLALYYHFRWRGSFHG